MRDLNRRHRRALMVVGAALAVVFLTASSCDGSPSAQKSESASQQQSYSRAVAADPAHIMSSSPTRKTINFWIDTWGKANKLAYVYLQNAEGKITGYYVLRGLPVSYCASLTPTYRVIGSSNGNLLAPAPSVDGVYYSGGQCNTYYGRDATTNAYIEYTVGLGINVLLFDQPLPGSKAGDATPLGPTAVGDVKP